MKYFLTAVSATFFSLAICKAQTTSKLNAISFELGKTGLIYNLGFDHKAAARNFGYRLVAGSNFDPYLNAIVFGGGGYYLVGKTKRFLELGVDIQYLNVDEISDDQRANIFFYPDYPVKTFYPSLNLGYRAYGRRTLFRIGFSPGVIDNDFVPGGYMSFGFRM